MTFAVTSGAVYSADTEIAQFDMATYAEHRIAGTARGDQPIPCRPILAERCEQHTIAAATNFWQSRIDRHPSTSASPR